MTRRRTTALLALLATVLTLFMLAGCSATDSEPDASEPDAPSETPAPDEQGSTDGEQPAAQFAWADIELTDVSTGETLRIADFSGKPVLVKTFAVW
ncbi:MAG: hypothetical protein U1E29_06770 [Coriobacteriia bacterium]|nr:hypothetical protein [Coriobacteriia bacterium]